MKSAGIRELQQHASRVVVAAVSGEVVTITAADVPSRASDRSPREP